MHNTKNDPSKVRFAAVGDVHVTKDSAGTLRGFFAQAAEAADALLLCGDLTDYGTAEEARILADELGAVKIPVVAVLGNHDYESGMQDTVREIQTVIEQMNEEERRQYLSESLFLNFVSYENERLAAYLKRKLVPAHEPRVKAARDNGRRPSVAKKAQARGRAKKTKGTR